MHLTEILIDKEALDLYTDKAFKYKIQVNKIASLKDREASFMPATSIPKTAKNKRLLQGLGIPSDRSTIPYLKPNCELRIDGFTFISKGWIGFEESDDEYKIKVYSGIIQFFKKIEGKTLGNDLDLSAINKDKKLKNVIESFTNPAFRYLITDYNGKTHYGTDDKVINIDYLVPSVNVAYLWDMIHKTFGFTYSGVIFTSSHFNNLWITYPKPIEQPVESVIATAEGTRHLDWYKTEPTQPETWFRPIENAGFPEQGRAFKAPSTGKYRLKISVDSRSINVSNKLFLYSVNALGTPYTNRPTAVTIATEWGNFLQQNYDRTLDLNEGDLVDFYTMGYFRDIPAVWDFDFKIEFIKIEDAGANFSEQLKDFLITDFIKDLFNVFGMTPYSNELNSNIDYKLITERYSTADPIDWSKKYVRRKGETYTFEDYAKQNFFRWQYNDKESDYHDASLDIPNMNLAEKKDVYKSKMYSPERNLTRFYTGSKGDQNLRVFKMYDKTVKERNGQTTIEYKSLDKRFHYCRSVIIDTEVEIGSQVYDEKQTVNKIAVIDFSGLAWSNILSMFYYTMGNILIDSRVHEIELNLDPTDVILLDQNKLIYFEQEQQYYVIDSIEYDGDEIGVGRFVRVKKDPNAIIIPEDPSNPKDYVIPATWGDNTNSNREGFDKTVIVKLGSVSYPVSDPLVSYIWERQKGDTWTAEQIAVNENTLTLNNGDNIFRIRALSQKGVSYYSNMLRYFKKSFVCSTFRVIKLAEKAGDTLVVTYQNCRGELQTHVDIAKFGQSKLLVFEACGVVGSVDHNGNSFEVLSPCE